MRHVKKYLLFAAGAALVGCRPTGSREELGNIVYEIPRVPGADVPYAIPPAAREESPGGAAPPPVPPPASSTDARDAGKIEPRRHAAGGGAKPGEDSREHASSFGIRQLDLGPGWRAIRSSWGSRRRWPRLGLVS